MAESPLVFFEDESAPRFEPVALTRSVAGLRQGAWTHRERWQRYFPEREPSLICRAALRDAESETGEWQAVNEIPAGGDPLFVAAAWGRPSVEALEAVRELEPGQALTSEGRVLAVRPGESELGGVHGVLCESAGASLLGRRESPDWPRALEAAGLKVVEETGIRLPASLPDLMHTTGASIDDDFQAYVSLLSPPDADAFPGVRFVRTERIRLGEGVRLDPGVVLDAREGAILLGPGTHVMANSVLLGPVATGADCLVKPQAVLMDGVSLGPVCKMGGEVAATIVQGFSNKQHAGFLGHSYLGSWVNLGAATDTSDLKNDYGSVKITLAGETVDTGSRHVGSLIGDHSKTAIHTRLNTGTVIGVSTNVFGAGFPPKEVPSFLWGGAGSWQEYRFEKALSVASVVTSRRGIVLSTAQKTLLRAVFEASQDRRDRVLGRRLAENRP